MRQKRYLLALALAGIFVTSPIVLANVDNFAESPRKVAYSLVKLGLGYAADAVEEALSIR